MWNDAICLSNFPFHSIRYRKACEVQRHLIQGGEGRYKLGHFPINSSKNERHQRDSKTRILKRECLYERKQEGENNSWTCNK